MADESPRRGLGAWLRTHPQLLAVLGLCASVALFVVDLPGHADRGSWGNLAKVAAYNWWPILLLLTIGFFARGRTLYHAIGGWFSGYFLAVAIALVILEPTGDWLGEDSRWQISVLVPVIEELAKALPILLVYAVVRSTPAMKPTVTDFAVLGLSVGGGFAFHEDAVFARVVSGGWDGWGLAFPAVVQEPVFAVGHAGWTALVGLGVGIALARRGRPLAWIPAIAAYSVVVVDHALVNDQGSRAALLHGRLPLYVLAVGILGAVFIETQVVVKSAGGATEFRSGLKATLSRAVGGAAPTGVISGWQRFVLGVRLQTQKQWFRHTELETAKIREAAGPVRKGLDARTAAALLAIAGVVVVLLWAGGDDESVDRPPAAGESEPVTTTPGDGSESGEVATAPLDFGGGPIVTPPLLLRYLNETETGTGAELVLAIDGERELRTEGAILQYRDGSVGVFCFNVGTDDVTCVGQEASGTLTAGLDIGATEVPDLPGATGSTRQIAGREGFCASVPTDRNEVGDGLDSYLTCTDTETGILLLLESRSGAFADAAETFVKRELVEWSSPGDADFALIPQAQAALDEFEQGGG